MDSLLFSILMGALIGFGTNTLAVEMLSEIAPHIPKQDEQNNYSEY